MVGLALQLVAAFNLVCTGTERSGPVGGGLLASVRESTPFVTTFRIDLERGQYCSGHCTGTIPLHSVSDTEITLHQQLTETQSGRNAGINRETGLYRDVFILGNHMWVRQGQCERVPFTGFPPSSF